MDFARIKSYSEVEKERSRLKKEHVPVLSVLERELAIFAEDTGLRIHYENIKFYPDREEIYLQSNILPVSTSEANDQKEFAGVYQVSVITPKNSFSKITDYILHSLEEIYTLDKPLYDAKYEEQKKTLFVIPTSYWKTPEGEFPGYDDMYFFSFNYKGCYE